MAEKRIIQMEYEILTRAELDPEELQDLVAAARAREEAGSEYYRFAVGAALRMNDDTVYDGWNLENIVCKGIHAEEGTMARIPKASRNAGLRRVATIGAEIGKHSREPVPPCGGCRQVMLELINPGDNPMVIAAGIQGLVYRVALRDLLPLGFFPNEIKK